MAPISLPMGSVGLPTFQLTFNKAMRAYKKRTKIDIHLDPLAFVFQSCNDSAAALSVLQQQAQVQSWSDNEGLMSSLRPSVDKLYLISSCIEPGVGLVLSPVKVIMVAIGVLLSAAKGSPTSQDGLLNIFSRMRQSFDQLPTDPSVNANGIIILEVLTILTIATAEIKQKLPTKYFWKLVGRNEVENALQRLHKLTLGKSTLEEVRKAEVEPIIPDDYKEPNVTDPGMSSDLRDQTRPLAASLVAKKGLNSLRWDQIKEDIVRWLSPPDPSTNHNVACRTRHKGTAEWFLRGNTFEEWKSMGSLFWIHGMAGSGKSILCSAIIEDIGLICNAGPASMAYFAFDFKHNHKQSRLDMIPSLLTQLSAQSSRRCEILSRLYSDYDRGAQMPTVGVLTGCLKDMLSLPGEGHVYIIIDGVDECPNTSGVPSPREELLELLEELIELRFPNLWLCVTSRPERDIKAVLEPLASFSVSLHEESGQQQDIVNYIKDIVQSDPTMRRWRVEDKDLVIETLSERAGGMFRWVSCQLDMLRHCLPPSVRRILNELPESLDETYERILMEINMANRKHAVRLLQCLTAAIRPLRVEELAEILAMDFDAGEPVPKLNVDWRWEDHERAVLSACSSLVDVISMDGSRVVQFSHPSVKEFLISERLASSSERVSFYHTTREFAHRTLAQACLSDLLRLDDQINQDSIKAFPLADYAARHWIDHVHLGNAALYIQDGMKLLFDAEKLHFSAWISVHDVDESLGFSTTDPAPPRGTPLYYATLCNFYDLAKYLLDTHPKDIDVRGGRYTTAIHAALYREHLSIARLLITSGADVNLRDDEDSTPLHIAAQSGNPELVRLLLSHGADVNAMKFGRSPPLFVALNSENMEVIRLLMDHGADVDVQDDQRSTPLHITSSNGLADLVRALLDRGANVDFRDSNHSTALHLASVNGDPMVVELLIGRGAHVDALDNLNLTPLHLALINENFDIVQLLTQKGADVNAPSNRKLTPLHLAAVSGKLNAVTLLVQMGSDVNAQDNDESTPIHLASENGSFEVVKFLVDRGADVNARDINHSTPLHLAADNGSFKLVELLIQSGADVKARDKKNSTALHVASRRGPPETVKLLLECGTNPNAQNDKGWTPLHIASQEGAVDVVKCLLAGRADVNLRDGDRRTPLHVASHNKNTRIVRLLIERGADPFARDNRNRIPYQIPVTSQRLLPDNRSLSPTLASRSNLGSRSPGRVARRPTFRPSTS